MQWIKFGAVNTMKLAGWERSEKWTLEPMETSILYLSNFFYLSFFSKRNWGCWNLQLT